MKKYQKINYKSSKKLRDDVLNGVYMPKTKWASFSCGYYYDEKWWKQLSEDEKESVLNWVDKNFTPIKSINLRHTSYGIKLSCEKDVGFYVHNDVIKKAMAIKGYEMMPNERINWSFNISERRKIKC